MSIADMVNSIIEGLEEMTSMANIAYLPSGFVDVKKALKTLSKQKKDWDLEILEDDEEYNLNFEGGLIITVPKEHWEDFNTKFGSPLESGVLCLGSFLSEALDDDIKKLAVEFKSELNKMLGKEPFKTVKQQIVKWIATFPRHGFDTTDDCPIFYHTTSKCIQLLTDRTLRAYGDDRGYLEVLINAIKENQPLNAFEGFKDDSYLYCGIVKSTYENVRMTYETHVNLAFEVDTSIYIDNIDVVDELEADVKTIKAVKNMIYPMGNRFEKRFFKRIKDTIEDLD